VPAYFYHCPDEAVALLDVLNEPNIGLQFDFYHVVKQGLDLADELHKHRRWVRHVQVAGSPQRNEPDLRLDGLFSGFEALHRSEYHGFVGFEYRPRGAAGAGLEWARPLVDNGWASWT
jgi:hydroxypyruvate isomerase